MAFDTLQKLKSFILIRVKTIIFCQQSKKKSPQTTSLLLAFSLSSLNTENVKFSH